MAMTPKRSPRANAVRTPHSLMPNTGRAVASRHTLQPRIGIAGNHERIDAVAARHQPPQRQGDALDVLLGLDAVRAFLQRAALDFRPVRKATGARASARPLVTTSLEFGFTTKMRRRRGSHAISSSHSRPFSRRKSLPSATLCIRSRHQSCFQRSPEQDLASAAASIAGDGASPVAILLQVARIVKRKAAGRIKAEVTDAQAAFDCVIRGGHVATAVDEFDADIGIKNGVITAIGRNLGPGRPRSMPRAGWCCPAASMPTPTSSSSRPPASSTPTPSKAPRRRRHSAAPRR